MGIFQTSVGKKHGIKSWANVELTKLVGTNKLFWLTPPDYFHSFNKQSPYSIDQYAIGILYSE